MPGAQRPVLAIESCPSRIFRVFRVGKIKCENSRYPRIVPKERSCYRSHKNESGDPSPERGEQVAFSTPSVQQDSRECHKCLHCASARPYYVRYYKLKTQMILIKPPCKMPTTIPDSPVLKSPGSSPRIKDECDDFMCIEDSPLDLRINCGRLSPGARDSGTESDDTEEKIIQEGADCKPYKKSLIKRWSGAPRHSRKPRQPSCPVDTYVLIKSRLSDGSQRRRSAVVVAMHILGESHPCLRMQRKTPPLIKVGIVAASLSLPEFAHTSAENCRRVPFSSRKTPIPEAIPCENSESIT
ncbi:hypothetical protein GEV33_008617 [Tenebrio molitor]|uniref:Uncharacterized protein n=1 Tax=Tenebrio molitor TaxID=7067 RepID=A0A8J6LAH6_TENMO|nr:hypothetical protein GEV33_008617 [Tenebrio molitor]